MKMILSVLLVLCLFYDYENVNAQQDKIPLIIEPIYPPNQNPDTKGYFDLSVNEVENQSISVRITNNKDEEITVRMKSANAFTNPTGGMMYEQQIDSLDTVILDDAVKMAEYIDIEDTVTVPPSSSIIVPIKLMIPNFDGQTLLGGVLFTTQGGESNQGGEVEEGKANFIIKTEMVNAIAIQLNFPNTVEADFSYGKAGFNAKNASVFIEIINNAQKIQGEIKGTYKILDNKNNELFYGEYGPFKMAPKSKIRYPFNWGNEILEDGTFTLVINGTVGEEKVAVSKSFTIGNADVEEYVERTQTSLPQAKIDNGVPTWLWIVGAVIFGFVMFLIGKRRT
jgi:hypothetical protein